MKSAFRTIATVLSVAASLAAFDALAESQSLNYTVLRDGKPIGTHAFTINHDGAATQVDVTTDIKVQMLFVTAYKFKHASTEVWNGGQLTSLTSATDDDGTPKELSVKAENGGLTVDSKVKGQDRRQFAGAASVPASLWSAEVVKQSALLNTLDGQMMSIRVEDLGVETVDASGAKVEAHRYGIRGELTRDLWFDAQGRLVRMLFPDKTSSEIVYALN